MFEAPESAALRELLNGTREACLASLHDPLLNWEDLIRLASAEYVLPALESRIAQLDLGPSLPSDLADYFAAVAHLNGERNAQILDQFRDVVGLLNQAGIVPVALKGLAYLLLGTYHDQGARYLGDIDLLLPASLVGQAFEVLCAAGYQPDESDLLAHYRHHLPGLDRPGCLRVEIHHSLGLGICQQLLRGDEAYRASQQKEWNGVTLRLPSPEHLIVHHIIHAQESHPYSERIWPSLRSLYDLKCLEVQFYGDAVWHQVQERFERHRRSSTLALYLLQAQASLNLPPPIPLQVTWLTRLKWKRRNLLHRIPPLRFFDPVFVANALLSRRYRLLKSISQSPGGWSSVGKMLLESGFYARMLNDLRGAPLSGDKL